ncbi:hypothetical protein niasHT_000631 [Heterodera trifolii]|uniref:Uncharacterized protein n=1 Tax=Heterodera trifolii TaxID=157864 RepID=A0ABD2MBZ4_9BILA
MKRGEEKRIVCAIAAETKGIERFGGWKFSLCSLRLPSVQWLCMPTTISVSPAIPDKLVVNGVDLVNRDQLSVSQNRELQRYIDANAHLLGFLDKDNEQQQQTDGGGEKRTPLTISVTEQKFSPISPGQTSGISDKLPLSSAASSFSSPAYGRPPSAFAAASLNRAGSPYSMGGGSEYGGRRKGVSWSDVVEEPRPTTRTRSNSPPPASFIRHSMPALGKDSPSGYGTDEGRHYRNGASDDGTLDGGHDGRLNYDRYRHSSQNPFDRADGWVSSNPWTGSLDHRGGRSRDRERQGTPGSFFKPDLPTYSALGRSPDNFNPFQTHLHREEAKGLRKSQEREDMIKFHSYGDHKVSGIEMKPKGWTGGEIVTDREIMKKSIKPRRFYYSPIGDGVVAADGIEMKRPPPDLSPRRYEYYQRHVEHDQGKPGLRVTESIWHEGGSGDGGAEGAGKGPPPTDWQNDGFGPGGRGGPRDDGKGRGGAGEGPKWPGLDNDGGRKREPTKDDGTKGPRGDDGGPAQNAGLGKFPLLDHGEGPKPHRENGEKDNGTRGREPSGLSEGPGGVPREGWTKEFITNPRELINQYGTETLTSIFDYEDHTPKTYTSTREVWSPAPPNLTTEVEEVQ